MIFQKSAGNLHPGDTKSRNVLTKIKQQENRDALSYMHQGLGRPDLASWYLIYGYVNGSDTSCPNGISFS